MQFRTDDGRLFETIEEAKKHEDKLREKERAEKELAAKKEERLKEVNDAYEKFNTLRNNYIKDYGTATSKKTYTLPLEWFDIFG